MTHNIFTLKVSVLKRTDKCIVCRYIPDKFISGEGDIKKYKRKLVRLELLDKSNGSYLRGQEVAKLIKNYNKFPQTIRNYRIQVLVCPTYYYKPNSE